LSEGWPQGSGAIAGRVAVAALPRPSGIGSFQLAGAASSWRLPRVGGSSGRLCGSTTMWFGRITWATVPPSMLARSSTRMP
jgi:hypothetical protein